MNPAWFAFMFGWYGGIGMALVHEMPGTQWPGAIISGLLLFAGAHCAARAEDREKKARGSVSAHREGP